MSEKQKEDAAPKQAIKFKSIRKKRERGFRSRRRSSSEEEAEDHGQEGTEGGTDALKETLELQKLRSRSHGISAVTLASGVKMTKVDEMITKDLEDPFKIKSGGLLDLSKAKGETQKLYRLQRYS